MSGGKRKRAQADGGAAGEVGRLVDSSQADDRRMIALVRARPLLYARNTLPVASYYTSVKLLWQQVADEMGWTVAEVRRKWSHVRNSYSRHLRNELYGVRTGRGRAVSRWYLADELHFLREHMATDTRQTRYSYPSLYADAETAGGHPAAAEPVDVKPFISTLRYAALTSRGRPEPAPDLFAHQEGSRSPASFEPDENSAYFQFFRGIYNDYQELPAKKQRMFRRECLGFLHQLLDDEDGGGATVQRLSAGSLGHSAADSLGHSAADSLGHSPADSDDERDTKPLVVEPPPPELPDAAYATQ